MSIATKTLELPVDEVALLEDRAHVIRRGRVELEKGVVRLVIEGVAPVVSDKTLSASVVEGDARVADARIRRQTVVRLRDEDVDPEDEVAVLVREQEELERRMAAVGDARDAARVEAEGVEAVAVRSSEELSEDAGWGRVIGSSWATQLDALEARRKELFEEALARDHEHAELKKLRQRLQRRIEVLRTPAEDERATLELDLVVAEPGAFALRCDYLVPGACWRPYHMARLVAGEAAAVEWSTDACVWQNTGEDWKDATLRFSTERASLGVEPPRLSSDVLAHHKKAEVVYVAAREQALDHAGLGVARVTRAAELPGIDDGGEPVRLVAPARATIPSDGRPWRVPLARFESEAELALVAFPELTPYVLLRATLANRGRLPVLAGPVDLIRDSGLVGRTSVGFVAVGERFELGFGPEAELRVKREVEESDEESRALSSWNAQTHTITVKLSNLGRSPRRVGVTERIPVSELEKVKVELDAKATSAGARPNEDGLLTWRIELSPRGHHELMLVYTMRRHDSVVGL